jgi:hypothetical protein
MLLNLAYNNVYTKILKKLSTVGTWPRWLFLSILSFFCRYGIWKYKIDLFCLYITLFNYILIQNKSIDSVCLPPFTNVFFGDRPVFDIVS